MSEITQIQNEFEEALEGLKNVHTQEELDVQKKKVDEARERLLRVSEEFRLQVQMNAEAMRIRGLQRMATTELDVRRRMTMMPFQQAMPLRKDEVILVCPECYATNVNWLKVTRKTARKEGLPKGVRTIPWCFRCKKKMVKLPRREIQRLKKQRTEMK